MHRNISVGWSFRDVHPAVQRTSKSRRIFGHSAHADGIVTRLSNLSQEPLCNCEWIFFQQRYRFSRIHLLERHMRNITAAILAAGLLISTAASAAEGALPAGKPAGVRQAELLTTPLIIVGVVAAVAAGVAIGSANSAPATAVVVATSP
jgi:hypothetical protein